MAKSNLVLIGASGHAKVIIDIIEKQAERHIAFIVDDNPSLHGASLFGYRVIGGRGELAARSAELADGAVIIAIGNNAVRQELATWVKSQGLATFAAIHPSAQISRGAVVGAGSVVMAGAVINADAIIGENVIINTGATIDHDCNIGDGVHIAPGCHICGGVSIGEGSLVGAGATIIPNIRIGRKVTVGAGSTVLKDVPDAATVGGSPAGEAT